MAAGSVSVCSRAVAHNALARRREFQQRHPQSLFRREPALDIVRVQDVEGFSGAEDPALLEWAATANRILLTHDVATVAAYAYVLVRRGEPMPGVFELSRDVPILAAVEDMLLIDRCSRPDEWQAQVRYLPLR